jgi:hypothetical protein
LAKLAKRSPALIEKAFPLPTTDEEVPVYLAGIGVADPLAPVAEVIVQQFLPSGAEVAAAAEDQDADLVYLCGCSPEGRDDYLVAMVHDEVARVHGSVEAIDPALLAMLIQLAQTFGPMVLELLQKWRNRRNPQPAPTPVVPPITKI